MTSKETLQKLFSLTHCNGCRNNLKCINENLCYTYLTIINQDLDRLEQKETPIQPLTEINDQNQVELFCPVCKNLVKSYDHFCSSCGQKLKGV